MKNLRFIIATVAILFVGSNLAKAQTADEIIQKYITAIGGIDNWKKIKSTKVSGSINANGMQIPITVTVIQGKASRMEISLNGMIGYQILTNTEGWSYFPFQGQTKPEAMTAEDVKKSQDELDIQSPLIDYQAKGHKVTYLGKDDVEGTECYKLKVTYANGKEETMYIDATNYYHIRSVSKATVDGKEVEGTQNFGNYTKLPEGIVYAMSVDGSGMGGNMEIKSVEINKPVDESIFKPGK